MNTWLIAVGVIIVVVVAGYGLLKLKASGEWESTEGEIIESAIETITRSTQIRTGGDRAVDYKLILRYRYEVNGREYTSDTVVAGMPNIAGSKTDAEDMLKRYPQGKTTEVFYNPANPSEAALITGRSIPIAGFILFGVIILAIAGVIIFLLNSKLLSD